MAGNEAARVHAMAAVQAIFERYRAVARASQDGISHFDYNCMNQATLVDAGPEGWTICEFPITKEYTNLNGVMHGGAGGLLFDMFTTIALGPLARPGYFDFLGGVTRTLNISYLRAIPLGTTVKIRAHVVQIGRTMAMIRGSMSSLDDKTTYATVEHHKVNVPTKPEHLASRIPWDDEQERKLEKAAKVKAENAIAKI